MSAEILSGIGTAVEATGGMATTATNIAPVVEGVSKVGGFVSTFADLAASQSDKFIPSLNAEIFAKTTELSSFPVFEDRPIASLNILKDTVPIASSPKTAEEISSAPIEAPRVEEITLFDSSDINLPEPEMNNPIETIQEISEFESLSEEAPESEIVARDQRVEEVIEEFLPKEEFTQTEAPMEKAEAMTAGETREISLVQHQEEPEMTQKVKEILVASGIKEEEAEKIAPQSVEQVLEAKVEKKTAVQRKKENKIPDEARKTSEIKFVRDESADEARRQDARRAIDIVFETETDKKPGSEVSMNMSQTPKDEEVSEIALRHGQKYDGSYAEILKELSKISLESKKQAREQVERLIQEKPAVRTGNGKNVNEEDIRRVLRLDKFRNPILDFLTKFYEGI